MVNLQAISCPPKGGLVQIQTHPLTPPQRRRPCSRPLTGRRREACPQAREPGETHTRGHKDQACHSRPLTDCAVRHPCPRAVRGHPAWDVRQSVCRTAGRRGTGGVERWGRASVQEYADGPPLPHVADEVGMRWARAANHSSCVAPAFSVSLTRVVSALS